MPVDFSWLATVAIAGYACWQTGDAANAEIVAAALAPWAEHFVDMGPTWLGSTSLYLGLLAVTLERPREAHAHFARATAMHERCGARAFQAHTALAWAELVAGGGLGGTDVPEPQALEAKRWPSPASSRCRASRRGRGACWPASEAEAPRGAAAMATPRRVRLPCGAQDRRSASARRGCRRSGCRRCSRR